MLSGVRLGQMGDRGEASPGSAGPDWPAQLHHDPRGTFTDHSPSSSCWRSLHTVPILSLLATMLTSFPLPPSICVFTSPRSLFFLFYPGDDFLAPASGESWDRLRLTCSQPFTRQQSFGLAFLRVRSSLDSSDDGATDPTAAGNSELSQVRRMVKQGCNVSLP